MNRIVVATALGLMLLLSMPAAAVTPYRAEYKALIKLIPVQVDIILKQVGDGEYAFESDTHTRSWASLFGGNVVEKSRFRVTAAGVEPLEYQKRDKFSDDDKDIKTRFEPDGEVVSVFRGKEKRVRADGPVVDLLTFRYVLAHDLSRDQLRDLYYIVDGKGRIKEIKVLDLGFESVDTRFGRLDARRLEYSAVDDPTYTVWAAPDLDYQLVRIEQHKQGKLRASLTLSSYELIEATD
ncbi:MAG: DUF3108 domain-containing protein [Gammaproteobacteria bacterium]